MTYRCDRCLEPIDRVPEGCADPKCPKDDIDELYEQAYGISYRKESARDAVIVAARAAWDALTFGNIHRIQKATVTLGDAINIIDALEHAP